MARPTKYTSTLLKKSYEYLNDWDKNGDVIPSHISLALHLEVTRGTLYEWGNDKEKAEFSDILDIILMKQERELLNNGLKGEFNSAITKLVLGKHGYNDKQEVGYSGNIQVRSITRKIVDPQVINFIPVSVKS